MTKDFSLNTLPYFTLSQVSLFYKDKKEASTLLSNRIRQKKVHKIREGIYISDEKYKEIVMSGNLTSFLEFAATHLIYTPSYLSLEYILFLNNIITENVYTFTLVTTKKTTTLSNSFGVFNYRSVKKDFYGDYIVVKKNGFTWYEATPEKALFDYLYLKRDFVYSEDYIDELRINRENVNMKKFENIIKKYKSRKVAEYFNPYKKTLMIIDEMKIEIEKHKEKADVLKIGYIKEYLQTIILKEIYEFPDCKNILFYGGTSLRFLFGLNRLSEDLDFASDGFSNFEGLGEFLQSKLKNYGLDIDYKIQKFRLTLKFRNLLETFGIKYNNSNDLYIKIEISDHTEHLDNYKIKLYPIFKYNQSLVLKSFDEETLFSTKLNAVLYRKREKKGDNVSLSVKGRDFYDLFRYLQRGTKPNIQCIEGINSLEELKEKLVDIVGKTDFNQVELDIKNFVEDQNIISFIKTNGKEYILQQLKNR